MAQHCWNRVPFSDHHGWEPAEWYCIACGKTAKFGKYSPPEDGDCDARGGQYCAKHDTAGIPGEVCKYCLMEDTIEELTEALANSEKAHDLCLERSEEFLQRAEKAETEVERLRDIINRIDYGTDWIARAVEAEAEVERWKDNSNVLHDVAVKNANERDAALAEVARLRAESNRDALDGQATMEEAYARIERLERAWWGR